jgi:hypothetical protein
MGTAISESRVAGAVREVTDDEVAFYVEHGWVKLERLITPELAAELLAVAHRYQGEQVKEKELETSNTLALRPDAEPFGSFAFSDEMTLNAQRLINRRRYHYLDAPVRYQGDTFVCRLPTPPESTGEGWHQDSPEHGTDRIGELKFWVALADVTVELGPMRFIDRSHRDGPLGSVLNDEGLDLLDIYPKLAERMTPPMEYRAGDATVHGGFTAHGTLPNVTDRPRLCHIFSYAPADTRWQNAEIRNWGSERTRPDEEIYPIIWPRPSEE